MMLSDVIAQMIEEMLTAEGGSLELRRNDLAERVGCVPSQINYVITSRFTPERGYIIESRRGGGGYIRITKKAFDKNPRVNVMSYDSLTVDFAKEIDATVILRGIRSIADFEYEKTIADANRQLSGIDTILLFTEPQHSFISSTVVRDVLRYGKDVSNFLPPNVELCDLKMQKV
jgi:transcriptional regulator CtsR